MTLLRFSFLALFLLPLPVAGQTASLAEGFDRADRNGDGRVTPEELPRPELFRRLDRNGDGVIEKGELPGGAPPATAPEEGAGATEHLDLAYGDHERHRLDLYHPANAKEAPIMVYVHGGGWKRGDKSRVGEKSTFFAGRDWVFVSVNYRLLPEGAHPANVNDVARALAWVHDHAAEYGGDPDRLFLMGHSAGAHLAALVATNEAPLAKAGKERSIVKGVIPLDTNTYDIPTLMESGRGFYGEVFGEDPELWKNASPLTHVERGVGIPPFLVCYSRGMRANLNPQRPAQANAFAEALRTAGIAAEVVDASDRNHGEINAWFGRPDDETVAGAAIRFLDGILSKSQQAAAPRGRMRRARTAGTGDLEMPPEPPHVAHLDLRYDEIEGVDPNLLSVDLYVPEGEGEKRPVMIMIHGGGWRGGDKASPVIVGAKMRHFVGAGYVYASLNYRLSPREPGGEGVQHPAHVRDCARAIAWIHDHVAKYGGDPDQLHLMGHSAGGHLAALVATNGRYLKAAGKDRSIQRTNVLLDPAAVDIPGYLESVDGGGMTRLYENAFGTDPEDHLDASPFQHIAMDEGIPPTLLFYQAERMQLHRFGRAFTRALTEAGSPSRSIDTVTLDHGQINSHVGMVDEPMTELIMRLHAGEDASRFPAVLGEEEQAVDETAQPGIRFSRDYVAGSRDANGHFLGGTETMHLVAHNGSLFAGNGYWTDQPGDDPRPGAQILRKDGPDAAWEQERNFPGAVRINAMKSVVFTLDRWGRTLETPVAFLLADAGLATSRRSGPLVCFVRDDATGEWEECPIAAEANRAYIRVFGFHRDAETGREHLFAGTGAGEIYRGSYDPEASARIRWDPEPEYTNPDFDTGPFRRCQGFCVANGKLYASVSPRLLERQDGPVPKWVEVFRWNPEQRAGAGLRGITAVPALDGGHEVILGSREQEGRILRIDPENDYAVTDELRSDHFFDETVGNFRGGKLVAYNRFVPGPHPLTGEPVHWLTVAGVKGGDARAAWLLVRNADASFEPLRVFDPALEPHPFLVSTRTLAFAPWNDSEFYTGGYDGAANDRKNHNTAWIFRGMISRPEPASEPR